jgi:hypothetical protein
MDVTRDRDGFITGAGDRDVSWELITPMPLAVLPVSHFPGDDSFEKLRGSLGHRSPF